MVQPHDLAAALRRGLTVVALVIGGLSFAFGQGWALGLRLGVSAWSAPWSRRLWICLWWRCWLRCSTCAP